MTAILITLSLLSLLMYVEGAAASYMALKLSSNLLNITKPKLIATVILWPVALPIMVGASFSNLKTEMAPLLGMLEMTSFPEAEETEMPALSEEEQEALQALIQGVMSGTVSDEEVADWRLPNKGDNEETPQR